MRDSPAWLSPSVALSRFGDPRTQLTDLTALVEQAQRYGFHAGELGLLLQTGISSEVLEQPPIFPIPNAPDACLGVTNLRGTLIPVYAIDRALGLARDRRGRKPVLLILGSGEEIAGLLIDSLPVSVSVVLHQPVSPPEHLPSALRPHAGPCYEVDGRLWIEFDYQGFITGLLAASSDVPSAATH